MKKFFAFSLFATLALSAFADYQFPVFFCNDPAKFEASIAAATRLPSKCRDTILLRMLQKPVGSFAEFCTLVDTVVDELKGNADPQKVADIKIAMKKQIPYIKNLWIADAWKFCQANPTWYDECYVCSKYRVIGMTDAQAYTWLMDRLQKSKHQNPENVSRIIDKIIDLAPGLTGIDVKADLQKLNRKYSKNLLKNKAKWEPIIAKIRTTLETY